MKNIKSLISTMLLTAMMATNVFAGQWILSPNAPTDQTLSGWWYQKDDGSWFAGDQINLVNWQWLDGNQDGVSECYAFNSDGWMYSNTTTPDGYTVDPSGAWTVNGVVQTKKTTIPSGISNTIKRSGGSSGGGSHTSDENHSNSLGSSIPNKNETTNNSTENPINDRPESMDLVSLNFEYPVFNTQNFTDGELDFIKILVEDESKYGHEFSAEELSDYLDIDIATSSNAKPCVSYKAYMQKIDDLSKKTDCYILSGQTYADHGDELLNVSIYLNSDIRSMFYEQESLKDAVEEIITEIGITHNTTQIDAVKEINKWMCDNYSYDHDHGNYTLWESLESRIGVCHEYAIIFNYLAQACGIESHYVLGTGNGGDHAWNMTVIDGVETYTDVCWNDTTHQNERYLMITKTQLLKDHNIIKIK